MKLQEIRSRFYAELNKPEPSMDALRQLLEDAINHATVNESAFNSLWETHERLGLELEKARATIAVLERPQPGDFVAGFILDTEGNMTYRVGKWPRPGWRDEFGELVDQSAPTP